MIGSKGVEWQLSSGPAPVLGMHQTHSRTVLAPWCHVPSSVFLTGVSLHFREEVPDLFGGDTVPLALVERQRLAGDLLGIGGLPGRP
jgi:hypothetical protein